MGKKRKSIATSLDEVDRTVYTSFRTAANSLSLLYSQAMNHQKLSFQAGERHGLEKLYQWICTKQEGGSRVTTLDIVNYIQNELDCGGEEPSMSPRAPIQYHPHAQSAMQLPNSGLVASSGASCQTRSEHDQQPKNSVFTNALSSPIRRSLQNCRIPQGADIANNSSGGRTSEQNRDSTSSASNDSSMDMHAD